MLQKKKIIRVARNCQFCKEKKEPNFKEVAGLSKYISERGRILSHDRTGVCSRHQRALATAVKRARHLALLPFVSGL
ncbi:MAG: 30S ribosomal protein S18 [Candidatus Amesbacteria bacterium GW2011_GWC2_47_8]|uniref:Small ribosomal subunit protein bS18 n=1 Tax=Candidatus Amesbacteria bacterium GW2011_GWC2_47_8 TaxID=1618367 RepID=A0A0G1TN69_9BACT|nr:MAG: 30S ribosomal protein S18 [Candidatus Amesbacteria bacterium GW2011_GWC2_47_8]